MAGMGGAGRGGAAVGIDGGVCGAGGDRAGGGGRRMAVGEGGREAAARVVGQAVRVIFVGVLLGLAGAAALARLMGSLLFGIPPTDAATYVVVGSVVLVLGAVAAGIPAIRASRIDPIVALRVE